MAARRIRLVLLWRWFMCFTADDRFIGHLHSAKEEDRLVRHQNMPHDPTLSDKSHLPYNCES